MVSYRTALGEIPPLVIEGNPLCPLIHLRLPMKPSVSTGDAEVDREIQERERIKYELVLQQIVDTVSANFRFMLITRILTVSLHFRLSRKRILLSQDPSMFQQRRTFLIQGLYLHTDYVLSQSTN